MTSDLTGKGKKAHDRLKTIDSEVNKVIPRLTKVAEALKTAVSERITEFAKIQSDDGEANSNEIEKYKEIKK